MISHSKIKENSKCNKKFSLRIYLVRPSLYGFGTFYDSDYHIFIARSPKKAIKRYFKWYERRWKQKSNQSIYRLIETSEQWGRIEVIDCTGFRKFYT